MAGQGSYPFAIRAQFLHEWQDGAPARLVPGFELMGNSADNAEAGADRKRPWRQADVKRAINAAQQAGLGQFRVEIAPDGTIAIVVGEAAAGGAVEAYRQD